jgi:hypothetical protein
MLGNAFGLFAGPLVQGRSVAWQNVSVLGNENNSDARHCNADFTGELHKSLDPGRRGGTLPKKETSRAITSFGFLSQSAPMPRRPVTRAGGAEHRKTAFPLMLLNTAIPDFRCPAGHGCRQLSRCRVILESALCRSLAIRGFVTPSYTRCHVWTSGFRIRRPSCQIRVDDAFLRQRLSVVPLSNNVCEKDVLPPLALACRNTMRKPGASDADYRRRAIAGISRVVVAVTGAGNGIGSQASSWAMAEALSLALTTSRTW